VTPTPTVSVVIPTHNRVELLGEAVASVLAERSVDLELIVVDDASSDTSSEWLAAQGDPRLTFRVLSPGRGGSGARNVGLELAGARYVLFLDDDDTLAARAIPALLAALRRHPEAVRAVGAHRLFGEGVHSRRASHPWVPMTRLTWREELAQWNMPPGAMLWRTDVVRRLGGWDESLRRAEDAELCLRSWRHPAALIPDTVMHYRYHLDQVPTSKTWPPDWEARRGFVESLPEPERSQGERLLRSRELYQDALERHLERDYRKAAVGFAAMARCTPVLALSPVSGPYLDGLLVKAAVGALLPRSLAERVSTVRRRRRGRVPQSHRSPKPE
jgi:glycosyltransferase involved in cell wall biosynthesis